MKSRNQLARRASRIDQRHAIGNSIDRASQRVRPRAEIAPMEVGVVRGSKTGDVPHLCQPGLRESWIRPCRRIGAMRRRGRHDQGAPIPEHVQECAHHGRSTTDHPANRAQGGVDQQGHSGRDADVREVPSETGFRPGSPLDIRRRHADQCARLKSRPVARRFTRWVLLAERVHAANPDPSAGAGQASGFPAVPPLLEDRALKGALFT